MESTLVFLVFADALLFLHVAFVGFIVFGLLLIAAGGVMKWAWVRNPWFRILHLAGIGIVVLQSWLGMICPLTSWEMALRARAGDTVYAGTFISHWMQSLLYYHAPPWVFAACYTIFGALVVLSWIRVPPRPFR